MEVGALVTGIGIILVAGLALYLARRMSKPDTDKIQSLSDEIKFYKDTVDRLQNENVDLIRQIGAFEVLLGGKDKEVSELNTKLTETKDKLDQEAEYNRRVMSMKKSQEVKTGLMAEVLAPFLMGDKDRKNLVFIGRPIDLIDFNLKDGKITFIEVKTGKSQLSYNQKKVRDIIEKGNIFFEEFRIKAPTKRRKKDVK